MKNTLIIVLLMTYSLINSQSITFKGCYELFDNQEYIFNKTETDQTGRDIFSTVPIDGQVCGGIGTCEFKIQWNETNTRWEFLADDGNGNFTNNYLIYFNTSDSKPNPPSLINGIWLENSITTSGLCGDLTTENAILEGSVQDNLLSNESFTVDNSQIKLYPNPVKNILNVSSLSLVQEIKIWSLQGQKVLDSENNNSIDVSALSSGMYIIHIQTKNGLKVSNFIKE